ncbi:MAG TPA: response regulator [Acidimicrobiales bacterium]|nr:response regulator [Acidimicrobiales bacterium]
MTVLIYEQCGNCRRRGAYVVPDRGVVRCKYCTASEECKRLHPSNLGAVAAGLHSVDGKIRGGELPQSGNGRARRNGGARVAAGVMSMDMATISVLAGGAARHRSSYPAAKPAQVACPGSGNPTLSAVVVDDDAGVRAVIVATLKRGGLNVRQFDNGPEGCAAILADPPDVAVLDLCMPGMDGLEVLVELRRRCDIAIVVVSGRSNEGDKLVARQFGADDYLSKPFAPAELTARVEAVIASRARQSAPSAG